MINSASARKLAEKFQLNLLIVFGSRAKLTARADSDLDVACYRESPLSPEEWDLLMMGLMKESKIDRIDLVDLGRQRDPLLQFLIYSTGNLLYESQPGLFLKKHSDALGLYWDTKGFRDDLKEVLPRRLASLFLRQAMNGK